MMRVGLDQGDGVGARAARRAQLERAAGILEDELGLLGAGATVTITKTAAVSPTEVQFKELVRWVDEAMVERRELERRAAALGFRLGGAW